MCEITKEYEIIPPQPRHGGVFTAGRNAKICWTLKFNNQKSRFCIGTSGGVPAISYAVLAQAGILMSTKLKIPAFAGMTDGVISVLYILRGNKIDLLFRISWRG